MRYVLIDLSSDNYLQQPQLFGGYAGEHNETVLQVILPKRMISVEYSDYCFDFQTSEDNRISIPASKLDNGILSCHLTEQITIAGKLLFNVVAHLSNKDSIELTSKTNMVALYIGDSPDGKSILPDPNGYKDEILEIIDDRVDELLEGIQAGEGGMIIIDQIYNPESENAQSGIAVAEAVQTKMDKFGEVTQNETSTTIDNDGDLNLKSNNYLVLEGGNGLILKGDLITLNSNHINVLGAHLSNLAEPEDAKDAANKGYVDDAIAVEKNKSTNGTWTTRKPFITFTADDGYTQDISILEPIFKKYNIPCCIAMISTQINNLEKRLDLQNNHGWEVICHSTNSTPFTDMTLAEAENAMVTSKEALESMGFVIKDVAYPSGMCNSQIKQIAKKYFRAGYEFNPHETTSLNTGILDSFSIFRVPLGSFTNGSNYSTLDYYKSCVDNAVANNGWLIFCLHSGASAFDATQQQYLDDLLAYIQSLGVETGNLSAGYEVFGNYIECGASANTSIPRTDAELLRFVVSNTGEHNLPIFKTMNLIHTNTDPLTAYPENKISISEISNYNAGFPLERGGTLITSRFDYFGFQIWLPDYVNHIYKRSWNSNAWRPWSKISTESADSLFSKRLYCSNNWSGNFNVSISNSLYIRTFDIIGSQKPTLTKQYFALSEISTDRDNPTIIGTTENGVSIQMCYLQDNYLYFKYGSELSNNAYIEIAYS